MKYCAVLFALLAVASANFFEDGKEYEFQTESSAASGTMDYSPHTSGFSYKYKTKIQVKGNLIKVQISDLKFSQYNGGHVASQWPFDKTNFVDVNAEAIPSFTVEVDSNGLFSKLNYPASVNLFQKNLIKAWAQILQINKGEINQGKKGFTSHEKLIHGDCDVTYTVNDKEIIKSVAHFKDCRNRVYRLVDDWRGHQCNLEHDGSKNSTDGLFSDAVTVYAGEKKGDRFAVKAIVSSGAVMSQFFETEGLSHFAFTNSTSILTNEKSFGGDASTSGKTDDDLLYEWADKDFKWDQNRDLKAKEPFFASGEYFSDDLASVAQAVKQGIAAQKEILNTMTNSKESVERAHRYGINTVLPAMYALDYAHLKKIAEEFFADKSAEGVMKSNLYNELLAATGTTSSALVIRDLLMESKFENNRDALRVLTGVPFHIRRPSKQLVEEYEKLLNFNAEPFVQDQIPLVFGHLVRITCERAGPMFGKEMRRCLDTFASKYVDKYVQKLKSSSDHYTKSIAISVLQNIRYGGIAEKLKPIIYGEDSSIKCNQMRSQAVWAAGYDTMYEKNTVEYFLPIFSNHELNHELRISAISMVFYAKPSVSQMANIMAVLYTEKDYEVINYVFTLLERYAHSINPCNKEFAESAKYFLKYMKQWSEYESDWGFGVSKTYTREFNKNKYGYGGSYSYYTIGSHKSTTPLVVGVGVGQTMFHAYSNHIFHVHLRIQGLAKGLIKKFKTMDPTVWKTDDLKKILSSDMSIREREDQPVRVEVILLLKGSVVLHRQYDETSTQEGGNVKNFMDKLKGIADNYSINHQRALQFGSMMYEQPTELGFPMAYMNSLTMMVSLKADVKKGAARGLLFRDVNYDMHTFSQGANIMMVSNPMRKRSYGIVQDRVYQTHFPRKFVIGVNPVKKEFKLSVQRPAYDKPLQMLMHSQNMVIVRDNSIKGDVSITENCPECRNRIVVTKGPDAAKTRVFLDNDNQKGGFFLHGEYFDCEMDINRGNTIGHLLGTFMPYNKNPKTMYNSIVMGLRQIRAFFVYFPRAEKCGAMVRWSQSKNNPVKEVEVVVRVNAEPNGDRLFFRGRKIFIKTLIKAKGEPSDRLYRINFAYEFTPGYLENKLKVQFQRNAVANLVDEYMVCFNMENKYPDFSNEFMDYDKSNPMEVTGKARLQYGKASDCDSSEGEIKATFKHSTTELARQDMKKTWYYKKCMEQKQSNGWSGRGERLPLTEECYMTIWDATTARKYKWEVDFVKLTDRMDAIISQFQTTFKAGLIPYWDIDMELLPASKSEPHMTLEAEFKNNDKNVDLFMETSQGGQKFEDIPLKLNWYSRMRNLKFTKTLKTLMNYKIVNPCTATVDEIRTMDNVTYPYTATSCWTLTSAHCAPVPTYAVFTKKSSGQPLAMRAYIGGHYVEMIPSGPKKIDVKINGQKQNINNKEYVHQEQGQEIFKIYQWGSTYNIYSFLKVWITYDGHYVQVVPAPSVKGQHCGMCGNYNRNKKDEFTGKSENLLTSAAAMVEDYKWKC